MKLSLTMIARNEQATLGRVLEQASRVCDELIVVDTGSTDGTIEIAKGFGAEISHFDWIDDFAAARNYALDRASGDWILWLDADDHVPDQTLNGISNLKVLLAEASDDLEAVMIPYQYTFDSAGRPAFILNVSRIVRRSPELRWQYPIHEHIPVTNAMITEDIWIEHRPLEGLAGKKNERNYDILKRAIGRGDARSPVVLSYAQELERRGKHEEANEFYQQVAKAGESKHLIYEGYLGLLRCAISRGDVARILLSAESASKVGPLRSEAYLALAEYCISIGQYADAITLLNTVLQLPIDPTALYALPHNLKLVPFELLSRCFQELGDFSKAIEFKRLAIPYHPEPIMAQQELDSLIALTSIRT